jgi:hypothetical protein
MRRLLPLLVLIFLQACGAVTAPQPLTKAERARLEASRLDLSLGVGEHHASWSREDLVAALGETRLFRRVARLEAFAEPPDLVAAVQVFGNPDNKLPFVTFLTLGLVPTVAKGHDGVRVTLTAPTTKRALEVVVDQRDLIIIGWVGTAMLGSQEWVRAGSYNGRMFDRIASELAARAEAIETLPIVLR